MGNIREQMEVIHLSIYCEIIKELLLKYNELSIIKVLYFSYIIKNNKINNMIVYNGKTSKNVLFKAISLLDGDFENFCANIPYILKSIHLLELTNNISVKENCLIKKRLDESLAIYTIDNLFLDNAIVSSRGMSDKQFLKEIISCV